MADGLTTLSHDPPTGLLRLPATVTMCLLEDLHGLPLDGHMI